MTQLLFRPYHTTDKNDLLHIFRSNIPRYFDPKEIGEFEDYLDKRASNYMTILSGNNIIGGTGIEIDKSGKTGSITWIFFLPEYAGKGLGRQTVNHCISTMVNEYQVKTVAVRTSQLVFKFFEKFGFKTYNVEKDYWGKGLDLYEMSMDVS